MCFVKDPKFLNHFTAQCDITCYKIVLRVSGKSGVYNSLCVGKRYRVGGLYNASDESFLDIMDSIKRLEAGVFHSFITLKKAQLVYASTIIEAVRQGVIIEPCIVECVIPKGSACWANDTEYASVSIKIVREI